jgi:hypothetical protein
VLDLPVLQSVRIHLGVGPGHVHPGRRAVQLVLLLPLLLDKQKKTLTLLKPDIEKEGENLNSLANRNYTFLVHTVPT